MPVDYYHHRSRIGTFSLRTKNRTSKNTITITNKPHHLVLTLLLLYSAILFNPALSSPYCSPGPSSQPCLSSQSTYNYVTSPLCPLNWTKPSLRLAYLTRQQRNKLNHMIYGNRNTSRGKQLITLYWNKGNSHMFRKIEDIKTLVSQNQPHIFGLAEANVLPGHDLTELQIPDYTLHLASSLTCPAPSAARVAVYTHKSITVKRRLDLEENDLQLVSLEAGLPGKKKSLYMVAYRQWQLPSQPHRTSGTLAAQAERWDRLLARWEAALREGREVIMIMDANLDAMTWRKEPHTLPRHSTSLTHASLIDSLFERILPQGVKMVTPALATWARGNQRSCLDHVYTTAPGKLSSVTINWTGMSDHAMVKFSRFNKTLQNRESYIKKRIFKHFQPDNFRASVSVMPELPAILQCRDVDTAATLLTAGLTRVLDKMAPVRTIQSRQDYAPHMGEETKLLQGNRNSAQERAVRTGALEDWRIYRALRNQTTASLRRDLASWRRRKLSSTENSPSAVWSAVKRILNWEGAAHRHSCFTRGRC